MLHFDSTIRLSDVLLIGGGIVAFVKVFIADADIKRTLLAMVQDHEKRLGTVEDRTEHHQTWLIRSQLDRWPLGRRAYDQSVTTDEDAK